MRIIEKKQYHGPAKALKEKHRGIRLKKKLLLILPLLTILVGVTVTSFLFTPKANVEENNSAIIETATKLRDSGIDAETTEIVLKESFKGYFVQAKDSEVTIGLYKKNGNVVPLVKILFNE